MSFKNIATTVLSILGVSVLIKMIEIQISYTTDLRRLGQMCRLRELARKQANKVEQRMYFMGQVNRVSVLGVCRR